MPLWSTRITRITKKRSLLPGLLLLVLLVGCAGSRASADRNTPRPGTSATGPGGREWTISLAVDATDGSLLKVDHGLFRSADRGQHWDAVPLPTTLSAATLRQIVTSRAAPQSLFMSSSTAGILRSDDAGRSWRPLTGGLPSQDVVAFAVHSFRAGTLYAALAGLGVFRTEDGGGRWQKMDDGPPARIIAFNHSTYTGSMNTGWLYAATADGPYLSMDCF